MQPTPLFIAIATLWVGLAAPGAAQSVDTGKLLACSAKVADAERLACYDASVKAMSSEARVVAERREAAAATAAAAAAATAAKEKAEAERRAAAEKEAAFGRAGMGDDRLDELETTLQELLRDGAGRAVFMLENGMIWRQAEPYPIPPTKAGSKVTLKRGALGSYRIKLEGTSRNLPVVRIR
jgi:hypothetical protein